MQALIVLSWFFILNFHPELVGNNRTIGLIVFIVVFSMLLNCGIMWLFNRLLLDGRLANSFPLYLAMPFALPALLISALYSGRSAVFAGLFVAGVSAVALNLSFPAFATGLFVCAVSTAAVSHVYDYPKFFIRAFVACSVTMLFSAIVFSQNPDVLSFLWGIIKSVCHWKKPDMTININHLGSCIVVPLANGIMTAGISVVLIMLMVSVFDDTCSMAYLSMIDRNHPLLKKLQMEAPGTYHHCERVALLAEEAANSVGAMSLKAQALALYHDVGKLASPEMFTENASGRDMFRDKSPEESAAIIRNHVEYGVQLAKKYNLKSSLRRAIESHHGDDFISFFYEKEKERTGTIPPEEPFRYPGPRPQDIETVILMLADCCEAAVCSLDEPTEENVRAKVDAIFNGKLHRGQLDAADITLAQLAKIRESFLKTFKSMNHTRISYARHQAEAAEVEVPESAPEATEMAETTESPEAAAFEATESAPEATVMAEKTESP
ncbi:MAG: HDIG domain-containing protein, partial [Oscillospiraceae bacterium]|nr:HDIG domain-containing protein [Oscillospiraceae bacterium]